MNNNLSGKISELLARSMFRLKGYKILAKNYVTGKGTHAGEVDFIANYSIQGIPQKHRELAKFAKEADNNWYYLDGEVEGHVTFKRETPKVGRNEPCPCGSGKKFKKCCGAN